VDVNNIHNDVDKSLLTAVLVIIVMWLCSVCRHSVWIMHDHQKICKLFI